MIKKIIFKEDHICFFKKQAFEFKPLTLLVGDQGCGKSTMLSVLKDVFLNESPKVFGCEIVEPKQTHYFKFDLEKDNPRTTPSNPFSSKEMLYSLGVTMGSHGEAIVPIMNLVTNYKVTLILYDEPETSLSLRSQFKFIELLKESLKNGNQIVLATHNFIFMEAFPENILSLEHNKYVTPEEFKKLESKENDFKEKRNDKIIKSTKCTKGNACKCANETSWYNNSCEFYIHRDGKTRKKSSKEEPWKYRKD